MEALNKKAKKGKEGRKVLGKWNAITQKTLWNLVHDLVLVETWKCAIT